MRPDIQKAIKAFYRKFFYRTLKKSELLLRGSIFLLLKSFIPSFHPFRLFRVPAGIESVKGEFLYPETKISRAPPSTPEKLHPRFEALEFATKEGTFCSFTGGFATATATVLTQEGRIVPEYSEHFSRQIEDNKLFTYRRKRARRKMTHFRGSVATLAAECQDNYYHFLFDVVPKLHLLKKAGVQPDFYYVDTSTPFQRESLALLGIEQGQLISPSDHPEISADLLYATSFALHEKNLPMWAVAAVRAFFWDRAAPGPYKRLFLSRQGATYRRILNEDEILSDLKAADFHSIHPEKHTFIEQISLFKGAEVIIAPHGAGLANLAFCPPGARVLEIFSPRHPCVCYWGLADLVGLDYSFIWGEDEATTYSSLSPGYDDILVDPEKLRAYLEASRPCLV